MMLHHRRDYRRTAKRNARPNTVFERLEHRQLLSVAAGPVGGEFKVGGPVDPGAFIHQSVDADDAGNFVVAWSGQDVPDESGSRFGVQARRYRADGMPLGDPFVVNTITENDQWRPEVAVDSDGDFMVVWNSNVEGGGQTDLYARLFDRNGTARGPEFLVNQTTGASQADPEVEVDDAGNFLVAWRDQAGFDVEGMPIMFRRFGPTGAPLGDESVAGRTVGFDDFDVSMRGDGQFIVAWRKLFPVGGPGTLRTSDIVFRRFDAAGAPVGGEVRANATIEYDQLDPQVAVNDDGRFTLAWTERAHGSFPNRVFVRAFDASATPLRPEVPAAIVTEGFRGNEAEYDVGIDGAGRSLVSWTVNDPTVDADKRAVLARAFDATGALAPEQVRVNTTTAGDQGYSAMSVTPGGDAVVAWATTSGTGTGVFAQRYRLADGSLPAASVADRHLFYNHSSFDGGFAGGPVSLDDLAIATDKRALLPGQQAGFANVSSYTRGVNGVMVDVRNLPGAADSLTPADVGVKVGPMRGDTQWVDGPKPSELILRRNAGAGGSDRLEIIWPDGAIKNTWAQVTLPAGELTGLTRPDVFYFGNLVGAVGDATGRGNPVVSPIDAARTVRATYTYRGQTAAVTNPYDFDHNTSVGLTDQRAVRENMGRSLPLFTAPPEQTAAATATAAAPGVTRQVLSGRRRSAYFAG